MQNTTVMQDLPASIQPKRDRNIAPVGMPDVVRTLSMDAMTTWTMLCVPPLTILKNDLITDDLGVNYIVESSYPTPMGTACAMRIATP